MFCNCPTLEGIKMFRHKLSRLWGACKGLEELVEARGGGEEALELSAGAFRTINSLTRAVPQFRFCEEADCAMSACAASARLTSRCGIVKNSTAISEKIPSEMRSEGVVVKCLRAGLFSSIQ
eukprot:1097702-Pleurochrysis_carterae.AAC.3